MMLRMPVTCRSCTVTEKSANRFSRESEQVKRTLCREMAEATILLVLCGLTSGFPSGLG